MAYIEKRSEKLARLWPDTFGAPGKKDLLSDIKSLLTEIDNRYFVKCNTYISKKQADCIRKILTKL